MSSPLPPLVVNDKGKWKDFLKQKRKNNRRKRKKRKVQLTKIKRYVPYKVYIKSKAWKSKKQSHFSKYGKECVICGATSVQVHHTNYKNVGNEGAEDLVVLCGKHHSEFHKSVKTKRDMFQETNTFIIENQEAEELSRLTKHF